MQIAIDEFHGLLADLTLSAGKDAELYSTHGVLLYGAVEQDKSYLVGESTNRYVVAQAHAPIAGEFDQCWLPLPSVTMLLSALKPLTKGAGGKMQREVTITADALTAHLASGSVTIPAHARSDMTTLGRILAKTGKTACSTLLWSEHLTIVTAVAKRRKLPIRFSVYADRKPQHLTIGRSYRAAMMPDLPREAYEAGPLFSWETRAPY